MLEQDYLMRIFLQFAEILRRSWFKAHDDHDPKAAAAMLENAMSDAVDIDGATLLSLSPESIASILQISGTDPRVTEYVARSLMLTSAYLRDAGEPVLADLRLAQAHALADAYEFELPDDLAEVAGLLDEGSEVAMIDIESVDPSCSPAAEEPKEPSE